MRTRLAQVRVESDITQEELSDATGIGLRALQELERGWVVNPGFSTLRRIAFALDVPIEEICEDKWLALTYRRRRKGKDVEIPVRQIISRKSGTPRRLFLGE